MPTSLSHRLPAAVAAVVAAFVGACGGGAPYEAAGAWPQFRGPGGLGVSDAAPLPAAWDADGAGIRWRTELPGRGNSSPVVAGDRVFLTAIEAPADAAAEVARLVLAVDLGSGDLLWQTEVFRAPPEHGHRMNTGAAPTPVTNGEHLWVYFGSVAAELDLDGNVLWQRVVDPEYTDYVRYGVASSPALAGGSLILFQDREWGETPDVGWIAAFDPATGEERWRQEWTHTCCAYSTPLVWRRGGREELVVALSGEVVSFDPATGERLWSSQYTMSQFVSSLVADGDDLLCALGGAHHNKGNLCLRLTGSGAETKVERAWFEPTRAPETASAVLYRDRIWAVTEGGILSVYAARTGEPVYKARLKEGKGYLASLVAGDGKVYAYSTWGVTAVIDATADRFRALSYSALPEGDNDATPAIAGGCVLLRSRDHLYCVAADEGNPEVMPRRPRRRQGRASPRSAPPPPPGPGV